ncbi:MAG: hypothetical protein ACRD0Q_12235 [Acidimicrobiales bacterium]
MKKSLVISAVAAGSITIGSLFGIMPAQAADEKLADQVCDIMPNKLIESDARVAAAINDDNDADADVDETRDDLNKSMDDVTDAILGVIDATDDDGDVKLAETILKAKGADFTDDAVAWSKARVKADKTQVELDLATLGERYFERVNDKLGC